MTRVIGVRFRTAGKIYFFSPGKYVIKKGDHVIVETARGVEYGTVVGEPREVEDSEVVKPLKSVLRTASTKDDEQEKANREKEKEAFKICLEKIKKHNLEMKLIDAEYTFDNNKVLFYFTADGRVDFRELVKDLAYAFHTRSELRQIGSRDQAKLVGGIGMCGRELCCCSFLNRFAPVNLKLARSQGLSLNPGKLNGACGRLMCCLQFEKEAYDDAHRRLPEPGARVRTPRGMGQVTDVNYIEETLSIKFVSEAETEIEKFSWADIEDLNGDMIKHNANKSDFNDYPDMNGAYSDTDGEEV